MPLVVTGNRDEAVDAATQMRENLELDERGRGGPAAPRRAERAVGGHAGALQGGPRAGRDHRPADRADRAAGRLRLARRGRAAAGAGRRRRWSSPARSSSSSRRSTACRSSSPTWPRCSASAWRWTTRCSSSPATARSCTSGRSPDEAREVALRTSGMAVTFSGVTVIVALAGLFLIDAKVVRSMAVGAIVVVAIAVLAAVTLLPALIAALGHRVTEPGKIIGRLQAQARAQARPGLLGALDGDADAAPAAVRARRDRADAADRLARAVAEGGHGGDRDVPRRTSRPASASSSPRRQLGAGRARAGPGAGRLRPRDGRPGAAERYLETLRGAARRAGGRRPGRLSRDGHKALFVVIPDRGAGERGDGRAGRPRCATRPARPARRSASAARRPRTRTTRP